jgi:hypothetical protein
VARLLDRELAAAEDPATAALIESLRGIAKAGEFGRSEFLAMCRWKSPRSAPQCAKNGAAAVRRVSRRVFSTRDERARIEALCTLRGVGVPTASAILTLVDPRRYGVLDIRVWKLLFRMGVVEKNPAGTGFRTEHWLQYLAHLRREARRLRAPVRQVELSLFLYHQRVHRGVLYGRPALRTPRRAGGPGPRARRARR